MAIELHSAGASRFRRRAQLGLDGNGRAPESRPAELATRQQQAPPFGRLTPRGRVPPVEAGDDVVFASIAMPDSPERNSPRRRRSARRPGRAA